MQCIIQNCMKDCNIWSSGPPVLTVFAENSPQYLQTKFERQSLWFNIVTSKSRLFHTHVWQNPKWTVFIEHQRVIHKEASGRHLLCPALFLWVLFLTVLDQRQTQERPSFHALYLYVTYTCCFFHSNRLRKKKSLIFVGAGSYLS